MYLWTAEGLRIGSIWFTGYVAASLTCVIMALGSAVLLCNLFFCGMITENAVTLKEMF